MRHSLSPLGPYLLSTCPNYSRKSSTHQWKGAEWIRPGIQDGSRTIGLSPCSKWHLRPFPVRERSMNPLDLWAHGKALCVGIQLLRTPTEPSNSNITDKCEAQKTNIRFT